MIELQTSVKQDDTTRTRTPKPGYLNLSIIDVGTLLQIAQQKTAIISDLPTLIFSRYETGTTGIFLLLTC
jgi:hypothetical protein